MLQHKQVAVNRSRQVTVLTGEKCFPLLWKENAKIFFDMYLKGDANKGLSKYLYTLNLSIVCPI